MGLKSKETNPFLRPATGEEHSIQSSVLTKVETPITETKTVVDQKHLTIAEAGLKGYLESLGYEVIDQRDKLELFGSWVIWSKTRAHIKAQGTKYSLLLCTKR
ncbi:hypothetical protein V7157_24740 [Neobacillus drentensis]|uniref:hypothetical protein n=1 Tax=Neobacillus drentensis TaxID=220684 RepID=UPI003001D3B0